MLHFHLGSEACNSRSLPQRHFSLKMPRGVCLERHLVCAFSNSGERYRLRNLASVSITIRPAAVMLIQGPHTNVI